MSDLDNFFGEDEENIWSDTVNNDWVNAEEEDVKNQELDLWGDEESNNSNTESFEDDTEPNNSDTLDNGINTDISGEDSLAYLDVESNDNNPEEEADIGSDIWKDDSIDNNPEEEADIGSDIWGSDHSCNDSEDNGTEIWKEDKPEENKDYDPWQDDDFKDTEETKEYDHWQDDEFSDSEMQQEQKSNNNWVNEEVDIGLQQEEKPKKEFNFNYKQVSLIVAGGCIVLALLLFGISKLHITVNTGQQKNVNKEVASVESNATGSKNLQYVPNTTAINYDSNVVETMGKITKKEKYLLGNQLIYDAVIEVPAGTEKLSLHYYCSKDVFDSLYESTSVTVYYQVASDNYFSIKSVKAQ